MLPDIADEKGGISVADWNAELFARLYSKMAAALGVTPRSDRGEQPLLAICNPGQYLPAGLDPATKLRDKYALSVLLDAVPQFSWVYRRAGPTISGTYKSVLDDKETPLTTLTPEQKRKLENAEGVVARYADAYAQSRDKYLALQVEYDSADASFVNGGPRSRPA